MTWPACLPACDLQVVRRELEPGVGLSRLESRDFVTFLKLAAHFTQYIRLQQVGEGRGRAGGGRQGLGRWGEAGAGLGIPQLGGGALLTCPCGA